MGTIISVTLCFLAGLLWIGFGIYMIVKYPERAAIEKESKRLDKILQEQTKKINEYQNNTQ